MPIRIIILSMIGFLQLMLVMFGCIWVVEHLGEVRPWVLKLRELAVFIGLFTLVYPAYILSALEMQKTGVRDQQ